MLRRLDTWLSVHECPAHRVRLICLPCAGGGASQFRLWPGPLGPDIEVAVVHLPGREMRFREEPAVRLDALVDAIAGALRPHIDRPYAVLGHSMGGLLAFELARTYELRGVQRPLAVFVAGAGPPHLPRRRRPLHLLPPEQMLERVQAIGGLPAAVSANAELIEALLPTLRCDLELCETYRFVPSAPLPVPLVVLGGTDDDEVPVDDLESWAELSTQPMRLHTYAGGHFFLDTHRQQVLSAIRADLALVRMEPSWLPM